MPNTPKYRKISISNTSIKRDRKEYSLSSLNSDKHCKKSKNEFTLRNKRNVLKYNLKDNSLLKAFSNFREKYIKIKKENRTIQSENNITNILYKQNYNNTFYDLIDLYRKKKYNISDKYLSINVFNRSPLLFNKKENLNSFFLFNTKKKGNKYIRFMEKEKDIINSRTNRTICHKPKIKYFTINRNKKENEKNEKQYRFKKIKIWKPKNRLNSKEIKFISSVKLNNIKKEIQRYKVEQKISQNIIKSKCEDDNEYLNTNIISNDSYKNEIEDLLKEKDKSVFLKKLQDINILDFQKSEFEKIIEYYAKTFLSFGENQIKKILMPKNTTIDKELLIILNIFMKKNNKIKEGREYRYLNTFDFFRTIKEVDNQTFSLQKKLIENQTGD